MRTRAFRSIATILSLVLLAGTPVQAGPITLSEVIHVLDNYQNTQASQLPFQDSAEISTNQRDRLSTSTSEVNLLFPGWLATDDPGGSLLEGMAMPAQLQGVEVSDVSDVEGTICDCGEILVAGGFPKWPLLFLAGIPFFFIHGGDCDTCALPNPTPTPRSTPTQTPVPAPEPASLLLLGSGLAAVAASLRRRRSAASVKDQVKEGDEG